MPGAIRKNSVGVALYRGAPPEDCEHLLERLCEWLTDPQFDAVSDVSGVAAILKAIIAHLYLAWIHPFGDGNGRTARLVEFLILINGGVSTPASHLLSNHYNQTRTEYYRQLDYASRSGGDLVPFLKYAVQGFVDGLRSQIERIRTQQFEVAWENYVRKEFENSTSPSDLRRTRLILDLSKNEKGLTRADLTRASPEVAAQYARKTPKTLTRDINALVKMGLMGREGNLYQARKEVILAFLPTRRNTQNVQTQPRATAEGSAPTRIILRIDEWCKCGFIASDALSKTATTIPLSRWRAIFMASRSGSQTFYGGGPQSPLCPPWGCGPDGHPGRKGGLPEDGARQ